MTRAISIPLITFRRHINYILICHSKVHDKFVAKLYKKNTLITKILILIGYESYYGT